MVFYILLLLLFFPKCLSMCQTTHSVPQTQSQQATCGKSVLTYTECLWVSQVVLVVKNLPADPEDKRDDRGSIPGSGRFPGGGHGNSLQYSCLENPHGQRSLAGYSPWGPKELDVPETTQNAGNVPLVCLFFFSDLCRMDPIPVGIILKIMETVVYIKALKHTSVYGVVVVRQHQSLSCVQLFVTLWTGACQTPLSMGFPRHEYWSGYPFLSPSDLPYLRIEPGSPVLQVE